MTIEGIEHDAVYETVMGDDKWVKDRCYNGTCESIWVTDTSTGNRWLLKPAPWRTNESNAAEILVNRLWRAVPGVIANRVEAAAGTPPDAIGPEWVQVEDFANLPGCSVRDGNGTGRNLDRDDAQHTLAYQRFIDDPLVGQDFVRMTVMDWAIRNTDRHGHNWLFVDYNEQPRVVPIDHGYVCGIDSTARERAGAGVRLRDEHGRYTGERAFSWDDVYRVRTLRDKVRVWVFDNVEKALPVYGETIMALHDATIYERAFGGWGDVPKRWLTDIDRRLSTLLVDESVDAFVSKGQRYDVVEEPRVGGKNLVKAIWSD